MCIRDRDVIDKKINEQSDTYRGAYSNYWDARNKYGSVMTAAEGAELQSLYMALLAEFISPKINRTAAASLNGYIEGMIPTWMERLGENNEDG